MPINKSGGLDATTRELINTNTQDISELSAEINAAKGSHDTLAEALASNGANTLAGTITSETFTAMVAQTDFELTDTAGSVFEVLVNNVQQTKDVGYTLTSAYQFSLTSGAEADDKVTATYFKPTAAIAAPLSESEYAAITPVAGTLYFLYADS